ncbi:MAG: hypothetical protein M3460_16610 [Actinomycetota bacterium]|nr:hypothetical protein [Actinomycetota bacterium]
MRISSVAVVVGAIVLSGALWSQAVIHALELGLRIVEAIILAALAITVACIVVRWILPPVLEILARPLQDGIAAMAGLILLPEYALTTIMRRMGKAPLHISYDLGDAIAWMARTLCSAVRVILSGISRTARCVHPAIIAVISGGITIGQTLGQL